MELHLAGNLDEILLAREVSELAFIVCKGCSVIGNGIFLSNGTTSFDIGCASLPRKIKHEGHRHPLNQLKYPVDNFCHACLLHYTEAEKQEVIMYGCEKCEFYIHIQCALRPHLVKHRWDPHPLYLILFVQNVADHSHDFDCEFCSQLIDPTSWFYHCNACDLSFHIQCIDPFYGLSNMKFGATNIYGDSHSHQHGLTLVLSKKMHKCKICGKDAFNMPVLECSPCIYIAHVDCFFEK
ncbi:protein VACUOLELESS GAMETOPHYTES-like [Apium graveolens]|uniref:protein VACUOLELESS GAMETOPHYTES-like n=1 Tax=Apium graveolens TaxID=4045 RepID=UPI003D79DA5D